MTSPRQVLLQDCGDDQHEGASTSRSSPPAGVDPAACRDPDDLPVLGAAVAGRADLLVTGDKDLLDLHRHEGIPIVTPRECYVRMVATGGR